MAADLAADAALDGALRNTGRRRRYPVLVYADDNVVSVFAPFLFGPVVLVFAGERGLVSRALHSRAVEKAGAWSYSIYLTHVLVAEIILWGVAAAERILYVTLRVSFPLLSEVPLVSIASSRLLGDALTLVYLTMVLAASALTYRFIETPGRAFFNSLATRRRLQPAE